MSDMAADRTRARLTPYELVFGFEAFEAERFPAIRAEAQGRGIATADPEAFPQLTSVGELVRELLPPDATAAALSQVGRLLQQAFHFWLFGKHVLVAEDALVRRLLGGVPPAGAWELTPPQPAGYLQLPRNLLWARVQEDQAPEPADGFFWTMVGEADPATPPYPRVDALLVLGLRPDRPGFSVMDVSAPTGGASGHWADMRAREAGAGADFSSVLPGGELAGLFTLLTEAEVLKLLSLLFFHAARHPEAQAEHAAEPEEGEGAALSAFPYTVLHDLPARG